MNPEIRKNGKSHFIWRFGILRVGLPSAITWALFMYFFRYGWSVSFQSLVSFGILLVLAILFMGIVGGGFWGWGFWKISEANVKRRGGTKL